MTAFALYRRLIRASMRAQLQYRASLAMSTLGVLLVTCSELTAMWALFDRFGQIRGWTFPQVALFYGQVSIVWAICDAVGRGFDMFGPMVRDGGFDRLLVRPRGLVLQLLGQQLTLRRIGRLAQGVAVLGYAAASGTIAWTPARAILLVVAIAGGVCVFLGVLVLQATSMFWTIDSAEVWAAFTYGGVTMSQYPLAIYRAWFRAWFLYVIPVGAALYFPGVAILGVADPLGAPAITGWLAPLVGPGFLAASLAIWRFGVRHYRSTGS